MLDPDAPAILIVDDEQPNLDMFVRTFEWDMPIIEASSGKKALDVLATREIGVIVSDQRMPEMTGIDLLAEAAKRWPDTRRILLTAYSDREMLLDAIKRGHVHEYVLKPWNPDEVRLHLEAGLAAYVRARSLARAEAERTALRAEIDERTGSGTIIGLEALADSVTKLAASNAPVLVRGETGTGKELVARAIHRQSQRKNEAFIRLACRGKTALDIDGSLEQARGGTLFLDEVAELPEAAQARLLDVLEAQGSPRIIAATREAIEEKTKTGAFREDLFFRLVVVPFKIPPLRERTQDIAPLATHFVQSIGSGMGKRLTLSQPAIASLALYDWPGNVRELRNVIERACVLAESEGVLEREDLLFDFATDAPPPKEASIFEEISAEEGERVRDALRQSGGNRARAARLLGIPRTTLNDRIRKLGIA